MVNFRRLTISPALGSIILLNRKYRILSDIDKNNNVVIHWYRYHHYTTFVTLSGPALSTTLPYLFPYQQDKKNDTVIY